MRILCCYGPVVYLFFLHGVWWVGGGLKLRSFRWILIPRGWLAGQSLFIISLSIFGLFPFFTSFLGLFLGLFSLPLLRGRMFYCLDVAHGLLGFWW